MEQIYKAMEYAAQKHQGQFRKGTTIPYIVHPFEVMEILKENNADKTTIVCGILHDTVEDTDATIEEISQLFGEEVANLVGFESEIKSLPYIERKTEHMNRVRKAPLHAKMVNCADKLSNLKSMYLDYIYIKDEMWTRFKGTKEQIKWYYSLAIDCFNELKDKKMYNDLLYYFNKLFG